MTTSFGASNASIAKDPKLQIQRFNGLRSSTHSLLLNKRIHVFPAPDSNSASIIRAVSTV